MKFWKEFKAFISKGNIVDLAIAVVIGTAFNKIVTSLVNDIIMPLITWGLGANSLQDLAIVLQRNAEGVATLTWNYGAFIQSLIDFFIIALTIFVALKIMMRGNTIFKEVASKVKPTTKEEKIYLKQQGIDLKDKHAVRAALAKRNAEIEEKKKQEEAEKKAEEYKNSTEGLLKEIRDLLKAQQDKTNQESGNQISEKNKSLEDDK